MITPVKVGDLLVVQPFAQGRKEGHTIAKVGAGFVVIITGGAQVGQLVKCEVVNVKPRFAFAEVVKKEEEGL